MCTSFPFSRPAECPFRNRQNVCVAIPAGRTFHQIAKCVSDMLGDVAQKFVRRNWNPKILGSIPWRGRVTNSFSVPPSQLFYRLICAWRIWIWNKLTCAQIWVSTVHTKELAHKFGWVPYTRRRLRVWHEGGFVCTVLTQICAQVNLFHIHLS